MDLRKRLTRADVLNIKARLWEGVPQIDLALRYGVSDSAIHHIWNGRNWKDVPWPDGHLGGFSESIPSGRSEPRRPIPRIGARETCEDVGDAILPSVSDDEEDGGGSNGSVTAGELRPVHGDDINQGPSRGGGRVDALKDAKQRARDIAERDAQIKKVIEAGLDRAAEELDAEAEEGILQVAENVDISNPAHASTPQMYEWEDLRALAPSNFLIRLAEEDSTFQDAVCIILKSLPEEKWNSDQAWAMVRNWVKTHS